MWRCNPATLHPELDEPEDQEITESAPSCLRGTTHVLDLVTLGPDQCSMTYKGQGHHSPDVAAVQADLPVPKRRRVYYFELTVQDTGHKGMITMGFTHAGSQSNKQPGWEPNTYAYHGDDGKLFHDSGSGVPYGPKWATGDIVGAGWNLQRQEMFFTKNGKDLGVAFKGVTTEPLWPTIGMHSRGESASLNFGQHPFVFALEGMVQKLCEQEQDEVASFTLPAGAEHKVVRDYLMCHGYAATLQAFDCASGTDEQAQASTSGSSSQDLAVDVRSRVRQLIMTGRVSEAEQELNRHFPELLASGDSSHQEPDLDVFFWLQCLQMLEMIRAGRVEQQGEDQGGKACASKWDAQDAISFARKRLQTLRHLLTYRSPTYDDMLRDVVALIAYEDVQEAPMRGLLAMEQREVVADVVNTCMLSAIHGLRKWDPRPQAMLEMQLRHLVVAQELQVECRGGAGEPFRIERLLRPQPADQPSEPTSMTF